MPKAVKAKYIARDLFQETFREMDGKIVDSIEARDVVYARAAVPRVRSVRKGDQFLGGVAMRASDSDVSIHPFTLRVICSNGAIMATSRLSRSIDFNCSGEWEFRLRAQLRQAFEVCASEPAFEESMASVRSALNHEVDLALMLMDMKWPRNLLQDILSRLFDDGDGKSAYGWMNAVTAIARTAQDPQVRWELETLGGRIPVLAAEKSAVRKRRESAIA